MLFPGSSAPDFAVHDQAGRAVHLGEYRGRWVLLWWFAKAVDVGVNGRGRWVP